MVTNISPNAFFRTTKLDESRLLELRVVGHQLSMVIDYAGATFDWMASQSHNLPDKRNTYPNREFIHLVFAKISRVAFTAEKNQSPKNEIDQAIFKGSRVVVIYGVSFQSEGDSYSFGCTSNFFSDLTFQFEGLQVRRLLTKPSMIEGQWAYHSLEDGRPVDIQKPFMNDEL